MVRFPIGERRMNSGYAERAFERRSLDPARRRIELDWISFFLRSKQGKQAKDSKKEKSPASLRKKKKCEFPEGDDGAEEGDGEIFNPI